ncbi:MAG: bifunctional methylenetetrahydrofolate dehydrogenase/methenyltetrahydrofolate cyclohydrolase FolD [Bacilli bacterium]|jgi:methylenetetrahydrofolate dehydrogenase (NADP+)/methenyltetrahydrofolate cyclohydrolase|nr:bifunctional methylenetetrahydrofolate dehydrogenase/methenyltetrahydrofolate cyclohydrolase FolD [Bacilli bacterium]
MEIIDGKEIAKEIRANLKKEISENDLHPGLAIIMVGNNPASEIYVRNKRKACAEIGIKEELYQYNEEASEEQIINCIIKLNNDDNINGIMVQSPLPSHLDEDKIINYITPEKDVDGFGISSLGYLASNEEKFISATPYGIIKLLEYKNIPIAGKNVVIIGRSKIVGRPLALALLNRDATVTITHSKTKNLREITKNADILIVAIGKANFIKKEDIKEGAIVIDVGINRIDGKVVGDVDFESCKEKSSYITPVPGGVGPMTIAMLLKNVVESFKRSRGEKKNG